MSNDKKRKLRRVTLCENIIAMLDILLIFIDYKTKKNNEKKSTN